MQILISVTHLLGTGHLSRALTLAHAFVRADHDVTLISGGMPAPHLNTADIDMRQLPALRSDGTNFTTLLTPSNEIVDETYLAQRSADMVAILKETQPDILITELFPFGRRVLRAEFNALLDAAKVQDTPCTTLCSIRDILAPPSKPEKAVKTDALINAYYDGVLVHSDETTTPLDQSWPVSDMLSHKLYYTGFVAPALAGPHPDHAGQNEVVVSAGGGSVGANLFECAIQAATLNPTQNWRLLVGGNNSELEITRLQSLSKSKNIIIERARPDFRQLLYHATCSVSMCGYNTGLDLMQAGCPSVFVPFDDGGEVEQTLRATSLAKHPSFEVVANKDMTAEILLSAVQKVQNSGRFTTDNSAFNGADQTVSIAVKIAGSATCK